MPRRLRYIPKPGTLVEITCRVIHGRMLLRPSPSTNEIIVGILARAKRQCGVRICAAVYMSNHAHLLVVVDDADQLAKFMGFVNSNIAREVGKQVRWREKFWGGRYTPIVVSDEPAAQVARLRYLLSHGAKEHLVARCTDWPGVHSAEALLTGRALVGYWFNRSAEYRARLRGQKFGAYTFAELEPLTFDPLPCWAHLDAVEHQERVKALVEGAEKEATRDRRPRGLAPLGTKAILRQNPKRQPKTIKRSPRPAFHAASARVRRTLLDGYRWFETAYRAAADRLGLGDPKPGFPEGSFPPALPFVAST